jgi:hypothetical protein
MSGSPTGSTSKRRDRGILTPDDREFLQGEKEYSSEQSERDARYRIRQRVKNAILDFNILLHHFEEKDRSQVFTSNFPSKEESKDKISIDEVEKLVEQTRFQNAMSDSVAFFYLGTQDVDWQFEELIATAVEKAEEEKGYIIDDVEVNIDVSRSEPDIQELVTKLQEGEPLTADEIRTAIRSGNADIDSELLDSIFDQMADSVSEDVKDGDLQINFTDEE